LRVARFRASLASASCCAVPEGVAHTYCGPTPIGTRCGATLVFADRLVGPSVGTSRPARARREWSRTVPPSAPQPSSTRIGEEYSGTADVTPLEMAPPRYALLTLPAALTIGSLASGTRSGRRTNRRRR